jgi:putative transport protein
MLHAVWAWFVATLRAYPELTVFLALAVGFGIGPWKVKGFALGSVTATLLAGILIGQLGIRIEGPIKATFFLLFLFAVGYGVGPQFFRGISKEGPKQIVFSLIVLALCLLVPVACAWIAGLKVGYDGEACMRAPRPSLRRLVSRRIRSNDSV